MESKRHVRRRAPFSFPCLSFVTPNGQTASLNFTWYRLRSLLTTTLHPLSSLFAWHNPRLVVGFWFVQERSKWVGTVVCRESSDRRTDLDSDWPQHTPPSISWRTKFAINTGISKKLLKKSPENKFEIDLHLPWLLFYCSKKSFKRSPISTSKSWSFDKISEQTKCTFAMVIEKDDYITKPTVRLLLSTTTNMPNSSCTWL